MCSPLRSTGWYKDATELKKQLKEEAGRATVGIGMDFTVSHSLPTRVIDENLDTLLSSKLIDISGGEPFFQDQFIYLIDKLVEHNYKGELKIITNITLITDEHIKKLQKLNTNLLVSLDGIGELYEYIRPSTPFGKYKGHAIQKRVTELYEKFNVGISYTPQLLNLYNIKEYIEWTSNIPKHKVSLNTWFNGALVGPRYLSLAVHPDIEYKKMLVTWLENYANNNYPGEHTILHSIITLLKKVRTEDDDNNWKFFCKTTEILDKHRKTSIINYIPELKQYWIKNI
jgi:organic radical activating enzyme